MIAFIEEYPNTEAILFFILVSAIVFASLYRFHKQTS
jgi:hypothetical protein